MKLHPEDPRLTAYLLGELGPEESAAVESAIAADAALQSALRETESVRDLLTNTFAPASSDQLLPSQRAAVLQAAHQADLSGKTIPYPIIAGSWKPWLIPLAAAAAVAAGIFAIKQAPSAKPDVVGTTEPEKKPSVSKPAPPPVNIETASAVPPVKQEIFNPSSPGSVAAIDYPTLDLPVLSGKPDLSSLTQSIRTERKLPDRDRVRLEEILNSFPIRLNGVTAIARAPKPVWHPDNRQDGLTTHTATLATETLPCPWKPSATLLLVSIRGNATDDAGAKVVFHPNVKAVARHHLLGFTTKEAGENPTKLAARSATTLAIEIEPSTATGDLGSVQWTVNGEPATPVSITRSGDNEPSDDARFAALVCAYAQWLAGSQQGLIDAALLSALSREVSSVDLSADRADFLKLIGESLKL